MDIECFCDLYFKFYFNAVQTLKIQFEICKMYCLGQEETSKVDMFTPPPMSNFAMSCLDSRPLHTTSQNLGQRYELKI